MAVYGLRAGPIDQVSREVSSSHICLSFAIVTLVANPALNLLVILPCPASLVRCAAAAKPGARGSGPVAPAVAPARFGRTRQFLVKLRNETEHLIDMVEDAIEDEVEAIGRFVKRVRAHLSGSSHIGATKFSSHTRKYFKCRQGAVLYPRPALP